MKKINFYLFLLLITITFSSGFCAVPEWEKEALDDLYDSTNGYQWVRNDAWLENNICQRYGVSCNSDESHVIGLKLFYNQLQGTLPESMGNLTYLQTLLLAGNSISGELPQSMNQLTDLTHLDLSDNQLNLSVFAKLNHLTHLSFLAMANNHLSGTIPETISTLSALVHLDLSGNSISDEVPATIWQLPHLIHLNLSNNQLIGNILSGCDSATTLEYLNLSNNSFSGQIPDCINKLTSLSTLYLSDNQLSGPIPDDISQLTQLVQLYLEHNNLEGNIPQTLGSLSLLQSLRLNHNHLSGEIPDQLGNLEQLIRLDLSHNELSGKIPESLGNLYHLESLYLNDNHLSGRLPVQLSQCIHLKILFLSSNKIQGPIPDEWLSLSSLNDSYSDFRWNALWTLNSTLKAFMDKKQNGDWEESQTKPPQLISAQIVSESSIQLSWTRPDYPAINGAYEIFYANLPDGHFQFFFEISDIASQSIVLNNIESCIPYYFQMRTVTSPHSKNVNRVDSTFSKTLSISILSDFSQEERDVLISFYQSTNGDNWSQRSGWLETSGTECSWFGIECNTEKNHVIGIQLPDNNLSGVIPDNLQKLQSMVRLDLRANHLEGNIPDSIGELSDLIHLDLSSNEFDGNIPESLAQLTQLEALLLYDNQLYGFIPEAFGTLKSLKRLYLEKNHLTGTLPQSLSTLVNLEKIRVHSNQLMGEIPNSYIQLTTLLNNGSDFRWNGLYSENSDLVNFLNIRQRDGADWTLTQNMYPTNVHTGSSLEEGIELIWSPIAYSVDPGRYEIYKSMVPDGPFSLYHTTVDKTVSSLLLSDLSADTSYYFKIRTVTQKHANNKNVLESLFTPKITVIYTLHLPQISEIDDQAMNQNGIIDIPFTVNDDIVSPDELIISCQSSNTGLIPLSNIYIMGEGSERTLRIYSAEDHVGTAQLRIIVDKDGLKAERTFKITVLAIENPPPTPTGLHIISNSGYVRLTWDLIENPFGVGYRVYRSTSVNGEFKCIHHFPVDMHQILAQDYFVDPNIINGQLYVYKIKSILNQIESINFSNAAQTIPQNVEHLTGDINGDFVKNMKDLIVALQVISEISPASYMVVYLNATNQQVGLDDAIHLLQYMGQQD